VQLYHDACIASNKLVRVFIYLLFVCIEEHGVLGLDVRHVSALAYLATHTIAWARPRDEPAKILCKNPQAHTPARLLEQGYLVGYDLRCGKGADGNAEKCARFSTRLVAVFVVTCVEHCVG